MYLFEVVERNIEKHWDWDWLAYHSMITIDFVKKHIDKDWGWRLLSYNKAITCDIINSNHDLPWCWYHISEENPNLTVEFITKYADKIKWDLLSGNTFSYNDTVIYHKTRKQATIENTDKFKWELFEITMCPDRERWRESCLDIQTHKDISLRFIY